MIKYILIFTALALSITGGLFSILGLSQLFAGASTAVIIMASVLEIGKVITTTALHTYWHKLARGLKIYLTISVGVLMIITSAGIYGFLSNAYQSTANKLEIHEGELGVLEAKKQTFEKTIADNDKIIVTKTKRAEQLNNLRGNQESRLDNSTSNKNSKNARGDIENSDKQIQTLNSEIDVLNVKNTTLSDSVNVYNVKMIELKSGSDVAGEVGPLKYISELTGAPMANIVNYMILLLIFVFDPLAIALILATNRVFELEGKQTPLEPKTNLIPSTETPTTILEVIKANNDNIKVDDKTGHISLSEDLLPIPEDMRLPIDEPILEDEQHDDAVNDAVNDVVNEGVNKIEPWDIRPIPEEIVLEPSTTVSEKSVEVPVYKKQPVVTTGKVNLEDIKEIKEGRGFSVDIPKPKTNNTIERIGSNKIVKNGDNNKVYFKRG
jgi:hypothetical protein